MSKSTDDLYQAGEANFPRIKTDTLFVDYQAKDAFTGILDKTIRYVEQFQLLDPVLWARFVEQFRHFGDEPDRGWRGEYWGKMMRGACFTWAYTHNEELYRCLKETIRDLITTADDDGRISSYPVYKEFDGWDIWSRKYVLLGMQYFLEICPEEDLKTELVASMCRQMDYIMSKIGSEGEGKKPICEASAHWRGLNSASLLEPVVRLYSITGEQKYLDFATYIVFTGGTTVGNVFELAYQNVADPYQYPITKAYELTSCFEGLLEYYRVTGIEKYKTAVVNFGRRLMNTDVTIIGCCGCSHENLDHSAARQTDPSYSGIMQETCVTVTWMKFCYQLLLLTGDPAFADCFEQSLYNAFLGAVNTQQNKDQLILKQYPDAILEPLPFDSYSPLLPGTRGRGVGGLKVMKDQHYYGCCACIGSAGTGLISKVAVLLNRDGVAMNLFIPGTVTTRTPSGAPVTFFTETDYPASGKIAVTLHLEQEEPFSLSLRIPAWSRKTALRVNGKEEAATNGYTVIHRLWKNSDRVELELDMRTELLQAPFDPRDVIFVDVQWKYNYLPPRVVEEPEEAKYHVALRRGPVILARDARLDGTVDEAVDVQTDTDGFVNVQPSAKAGFDTIEEFRVPQENGKPAFTVIDYSSAGKTWREDSKCCCWIPTREYWK